MANFLRLSALLSLSQFTLGTPFVGSQGTELFSRDAFYSLPKSYAALGDDYAAGLGSGLPKDSDEVCLRQSGSYSTQLSNLLNPNVFKDVTCAGDQIADIKEQIKKLGGEKFDLITLSIGAKDFYVDKLGPSCIYYPLLGQEGIDEAPKACAEAARRSSARLQDQKILAELSTTIELIRSTALNEGGRIFFTGYAELFAEPLEADACESMSFFFIEGFGASKMTAHNRRQVNGAIRDMNALIKEYAEKAGDNVEFVDWNALFDGHRFCEPGSLDPKGAYNESVWINDMTTILQVPGRSDKFAELAIAVDLEDPVQAKSALLPKVGAHTQLAAIMNSKFQSGITTQP